MILRLILLQANTLKTLKWRKLKKSVLRLLSPVFHVKGVLSFEEILLLLNCWIWIQSNHFLQSLFLKIILSFRRHTLNQRSYIVSITLFLSQFCLFLLCKKSDYGRISCFCFLSVPALDLGPPSREMPTKTHTPVSQPKSFHIISYIAYIDGITNILWIQPWRSSFRLTGR